MSESSNNLLQRLDDHYWMHQAIEVLYNKKDDIGISLIPLNLEISSGSPLYLKRLSEFLNEQLVALRQWVGDAMNWNNGIDYMIEVLQSSRMEDNR